jgi:hypothetical protein
MNDYDDFVKRALFFENNDFIVERNNLRVTEDEMTTLLKILSETLDVASRDNHLQKSVAFCIDIIRHLINREARFKYAIDKLHVHGWENGYDMELRIGEAFELHEALGSHNKAKREERRDWLLRKITRAIQKHRNEQLDGNGLFYKTFE